MSELEQHVDESAELYAAGALDELESARVRQHVAACTDCARRVGEAEQAVLALIEADESLEAPPELDRRIHASFSRRTNVLPWIAAVAAAFVLGLLPWTLTMQQQRDAAQLASRQQLAMVSMLNSHFLHAPFVPVTTGAPAAKVIYARDGAWMYVLVAPGAGSLDVVAISGGKRTDVATIPAGTAMRSSSTPAAPRSLEPEWCTPPRPRSIEAPKI